MFHCCKHLANYNNDQCYLGAGLSRHIGSVQQLMGENDYTQNTQVPLSK